MKNKWLIGIWLVLLSASVVAKPTYLVEVKIMHNGIDYANSFIKAYLNTESSIDTGKMKFSVILHPGKNKSMITINSELALLNVMTVPPLKPQGRLPLDFGEITMNEGLNAIYSFNLSEGNAYTYKINVKQFDTNARIIKATPGVPAIIHPIEPLSSMMKKRS